MLRSFYSRAFWLSGAALLPFAAPAFAQDAPQERAEEAQNGGVEAIVVTAQRRGQNLQSVPISVSAITANGLAAKGVTNAQELSALVPGLQFGSNGTNGTPFIRGVGGVLTNPSDEPSVATYVDGVYIASPNSNTLSFGTIERIEVLKGPQGTLFGRNATGGVIQVITRDPAATPRMEASVGYGNYQTVTGSVYASTPITDQLGFNVTAQLDDQGQGWGRDITSGRQTYKKKEYSVRSKLVYDAGPTKVTLAGDYSYYKSTGLAYIRPEGVPYPDGVLINLDPYDARSGTNEVVNKEAYGGSLTVNHDLGGVVLRSITAYRRTKGRNFFDFDMTPLDLISADLALKQNNFSQEFHVASGAGSRVEWLVGAYYYDGEGGDVPGRVQGAALAPFAYVDTFGEIKTKSYALFGQATVEVLPDTRLTAGLRYTWERQRLHQTLSSDLGVLVADSRQRQSFEKPTWRIAIDRKMGPDVLAYVSYNRGLKSGGWDVLADPGTPGYEPEELDAYEAGLKMELFDRKARVNLSAFYYKYRNLQVQNQVGTASITTNAARARIRGVDAEIEIVPFQGFTLNLAGAYLDGRYEDYPNALGTLPAGGPTVIESASDNRTVRTPKFSGNVSASYRVPVGDGEVTAAGSYSFSSSFFWFAENRLNQPAYGTLNGSLTWDIDRRLMVRAWGKNLTDKRYLESGVSSSLGDQLVYAAPRTYGITLGIKFN